MICEATIKTALRADGSTSVDQLGSTPPLRLMPTPDCIYIVGAAAGPLNGDRIALEIDVAAGTALTIRSAAASMAWPGTSPVASQFSIRAKVGPGARLNWMPEPIVPIVGSLHRVTAAVEVATGGGVAWREEIVLGRHDELPGELSSRLEITSNGQPLLRQEVVVGANAYSSPAVLATHRATGSITMFGPEFLDLEPGFGAQSSSEHGEMAVLELELGGRQVIASADGAVQLRKLLEHGETAVREQPLQRGDRVPA